MQSDTRADVHADVHPGVLQTVALTVRPTHGEAVAHETKVLDLEPQPDGSTTLVVACPTGADAREHHFDATVAWTYPLGRMECAVNTQPGRRAYGDVWLLRPISAVARLQQRAFFRARVSVPVLLRWEIESDEPEVEPTADTAALDEQDQPTHVELSGVAIDVSEGGVLATVSAAPPPVGTLIEATVRVDGEALEQKARIVRHVHFASGGYGVAIAFLDPTRHGDRIRRLVFESERLRRRRR